jgi:N-acyl amino acid synthase of PEP-CTERM/exosortase system
MIINRFETVLADSDTAKSIHYGVRYKVFCEEARFEDAERFPDGEEHDGFDAGATHFIVWDRLARQWVGAMRLVPAAQQQMPCEAICGTNLIGEPGDRERSVEFSRLCIPGGYRRTESGFRFGHWKPYGSADDQGIPVFFRQEDNEILQRLLRASFAWGMSQGIDYCYFIINRALARLLKRLGIPLHVRGEAVEHRGARTPHCYDVRAAHAGMLAELSSYAHMVEHSPGYIAFSDFVAEDEMALRTGTNLYTFPSEVIFEQQSRHSRRAVRGGERMPVQAA